MYRQQLNNKVVCVIIFLFLYVGTFLHWPKYGVINWQGKARRPGSGTYKRTILKDDLLEHLIVPV